MVSYSDDGDSHSKYVLKEPARGNGSTIQLSKNDNLLFN